jgi:hypothetical protein
MSMLTDTDLSDHDPTAPGKRERADAQARTGPIGRHRRLAIAAGVLGVAALGIGLGTATLVGGSAANTEAASVVVVAGESVPVDPGATVTVRLMNADGSFSGQADANGTVRFEDDIPPGSYTVFVTVDSAPVAPTGGIDIGTALHAFSSPKITLKSGVNTLDLSSLTQES